MPTKTKTSTSSKAKVVKTSKPRTGSAKKTVAKKAVVKKVVAKAPQKVVVKKGEAKKPATKKLVAKKGVVKKIASKRVATKKISSRLTKEDIFVQQAFAEDPTQTVVQVKDCSIVPDVTIIEKEERKNKPSLEIHRKLYFVRSCESCSHMPMRANKLVTILSVTIVILSGMLISQSLPHNFQMSSISMGSMINWITSTGNTSKL